MATTSYIGKQLPDGKVKYIYCHWDGQLDNNGKILVENYNTSEKLDQLLELGNLSVLGPEIGEKRDFDSPLDRKYCLAYDRDRGEPNQGAKTCELDQYDSEFVNYAYLYTDEGWKWKRGSNDEWKIVQSYLSKNYENQ